MFLRISALIWLFAALPAFGQSYYHQSLGPVQAGEVRIFQDERISWLLEKHIESNQRQGGIPGYRIRIFSQSGQNARQNANAVRAQFLNRYPDVEGYLSYDAPNFKVYVGDFRTRSEALKFYNRLVRDFPNAFIINDIINLPRE